MAKMTLDGTLGDKTSFEKNRFLERVILFCQTLHEEGIPVSPSDTLDAARALIWVELGDSGAFHDALKTVLAKRPEDYPAFDALFRQFWLGEKRVESPVRNPAGNIRLPKQTGQDLLWSKTWSPPQAPNPLQMMISSSSASKETPGERVFGIYSPLETFGRKEFGKLARWDAPILRRGLRRFGRRMATREGRRSVISRQGRIDLRKMFRASLRSGGHLTDILLSGKKISKSRLVILCDISGSMDAYSDKLLKLLYFASNTIPGTRAFGFSTGLVSLDKLVRGKSLREAARLISENVDIWSSGTRIGEALSLLLSRKPGILRESSVVVIISDGWEIGDLDALRRGLSEVRKRVSAIVWLNPQADNSNYSPLAAGMKAALPLVDVFSGLDILTDRGKFERIFGKVIHPASGRNFTSTNTISSKD